MFGMKHMMKMLPVDSIMGMLKTKLPEVVGFVADKTRQDHGNSLQKEQDETDVLPTIYKDSEGKVWVLVLAIDKQFRPVRWVKKYALEDELAKISKEDIENIQSQI